MNLRSKWWPKDFSLGESINSGLFFINFSFSFIFALYYFIPLTVESPSKGETLGNVSHVPVIGFPLTPPISLHPPGDPSRGIMCLPIGKLLIWRSPCLS